MIIDLSLVEIIDKPRTTFQLSKLEENNFDWIKCFTKNEENLVKIGIAFAEDLPGMLDEFVNGPLKINEKFTFMAEPD